jgi:pantoate--beta-alanine ligase
VNQAAPLVATTRQELAAALGSVHRREGKVGLVPTMGALHDGHVALMSCARSGLGDEDALVVSIFVNPLQFGPTEDLDRYPRSFEEDLRRCALAGVDVVFAPSVDEVYPGGDPEVTVEPGPLGTVLEGATRPGHFRGVLTVVAKLFGLVGPDLAVFGQKDYQQLVLVRRMVADLCLPLEVVGAATVREPDGLALSSRNRYLSAQERADALALARALRAADAVAADGPAAALTAARAVLDEAPGIDLDYLALTAPDLGPVPESGAARVLVAARVGSTRLIDNLPVHLGP